MVNSILQLLWRINLFNGIFFPLLRLWNCFKLPLCKAFNFLTFCLQYSYFVWCQLKLTFEIVNIFSQFLCERFLDNNLVFEQYLFLFLWLFTDLTWFLLVLFFVYRRFSFLFINDLILIFQNKPSFRYLFLGFLFIFIILYLTRGVIIIIPFILVLNLLLHVLLPWFKSFKKWMSEFTPLNVPIFISDWFFSAVFIQSKLAIIPFFWNLPFLRNQVDIFGEAASFINKCFHLTFLF